MYQVGDSLAYGTALYLESFLHGWKVEENVRISMQVTDVPGIVRSRGGSLPAVVIVSAGTNGHPGSVSLFGASVRATVRAVGPGRCLIWANIVRPPYEGISYDRLNRTLQLLADRYRNLVVFDWAGLVARHPAWLGSDGVHVTSTGYRARARALARAVRRCA